NLVIQNKLFDEFKNFIIKANDWQIEKNFPNACAYGYLFVAQYFFNKYDIDIHIDDECAFRGACYNNHMEIAKWLFKLSNEIYSPSGLVSRIDIHAEDDFAFRLACYNGLIEMAIWLFNLGNEIYSPINIHA